METKALKIAERVHSGQYRRDGSNYIEHPKRVANHVSNLTDDKEVICAAYLHDVLEDCAKDNLEVIRKLKEEIKSLSPRVLEYVENLSHDNGENYQDYVKNIAKSDKLLIVKMCDIIDNLSTGPSEKSKEKYLKALTILIGKLRIS